MNTFKKYFFLSVFTLGLLLTGCVDNDFDAPENTLTITDDEVITIAEVMDLLGNGNSVVFDESNIGAEPMYIKATINADDASGNFFKTLSFQDATGALSIIPDRNELNAEFSQGNTLYVKLNGLTLTYDAGLPRLGYSIENNRLQRIPDILVNDFLFAGGKGEELVPEVTTIEALGTDANPFYNKLVQLNNVEFSIAFVGQPYADADDPEGPQSTNAIIQDCDGNEIILRNSGFSDFAREIMPVENGSLVGIVSQFNNDLQMFIRDLNDVQFTEERCDGSGGGQAENEITIQSIQDRFYDLGADKAEEGYITGTVISDRNAGQVNERNIIIQNGEDGIVVRFTGEHFFDVGDVLQITVSGQEVSEFNSVLQVNNVPLFNAERTGTSALPDPRELTVTEILQDNNTYESTRVLIKGATLSGPSTFAGTVVIDDGTGQLDLFTWNDAAYANDPVPSGSVDVIGMVGEYQGTTQLVLNSSSDVSGGTIDPGGDDNVNTGFNNYNDDEPINKEGWETIATKGTRTWYSSSFDGERFAECEAYQDTNPETEAWLITPTIDTDDKFRFSFQSSQAFWAHDGFTVWVSQDFTNFEDANWIAIEDIRLPTEDDDFFVFVDSGEIDLRDYLGGKVRVGFKYEGTSSQNTTKIRLENVELK